jgi:cell division protein FtsQ
MTVALQIRKRQAGKRRAKRLAIAILVFALAAACVWAVLFSDWLRVRKIEVTGNSLCPAETIIAAADVDLGTAMARVDLAEVAEQVGAIPMVAHADVTRTWPNTLTITVLERTLVIQRLDNGVYEWIASDGVIFNATLDRQDVPVVRSASTEQRLMADAATVAQALPPELVSRLVEIQAAGRDTIVIQLDGYVQVIWGSADESELKAQVIVPLLQVGGTIYDVSAPGFPTVR